MEKLFLSYLMLFIIAGAIFLSCKKEKYCIVCNGNPPIAMAGPDQVITLPTDSIALDGSASSDPDGTISEWLWKKISGPASFTMMNPAVSKTSVKNLVAGTYQFELIVKDDKGLSAKDTMQVIVDAVAIPKHPPVANAGNDTTITLPANTVNLDGSKSTDPDNNIISYAWTYIAGPLTFSISNANAVQTQVTKLVEGIYQFELKVTDAEGLYDKDTVLVTVTDNTPEPGVYIAGGYATGGVEIPFYYEDGIRTDLGNNGRARSIFVSGADVYVAGNNNGYPCYWKNGVKIDLPTTGSGGDANSILVYGTDVYVAGNVYEAGRNNDYPCYWKNGARIDLNLTVGDNGGIGNSIFVSGTDVYVGGRRYYSLGSDDYSRGCYWKNEVKTDLQEFELGGIKSIFVSGADLYVLYITGFSGVFDLITGVNYFNETYSIYCFKNGVINNLPIVNSIKGNASSIFVSGTDVYMSGNYAGGPCYWKNGVRTDLSRIGSGGTSSIFVHGTDVYVAGRNNGYPCYWKNGVRRDFSNITNGWFSSIFVKR